MPTPHTVARGESLSRIAVKYRVPSWREIYRAPENAAFRRKRPNPDLIYPGDVVIIPSPWGDVGEPPPDRKRPPAHPGLCSCDRFGLAPRPGGPSRFLASPGTRQVAQFQAGPPLPGPPPPPFVVPPPSATPPAAPPTPSPRDAAIAIAPQAFIWAGRAHGALGRIAGRIRQDQPVENEGGAWNGLDISFRVGSITDKAQRLTRIEAIRQRYLSIMETTSRPGFLFAEDLVRTHAYGECVQGGSKLADQKITFFKPFVHPFSGPFVAMPSGPIFRTTVVIHEAAHFADSALGHVADPIPAPDGAYVPRNNPYPGNPNWTTMTADMALNNAYSYAQYCLHLEKGADFRMTTFAV
jgi:hypothetical protein